MTTLSPSAMGTPASSVSHVAVRRMCRTGDAWRMISSTALSTRSGRAYSRSSWSGLSTKALMPLLIAVRVVSFPANTSTWNMFVKS